MKAHWKYFKYVARHKWFVFLACLEYGLIWRGIKHDWTKFLPSEWFPYVEYFYGRKPNNGATGYAHQLKPDDTDFNYAWNHHQKRNSHHWQYYVLNFDEGGLLALDMPILDRKEMIADWRGAGMAQGRPKTWEWYEVNKDRMQLHSDTRQWVENEMDKLKKLHDLNEWTRKAAP